jgi:hypothetical protein
MKPDEAIQEIRKVRHEISKRYNHNTKALLDHYKKLEKKYKKRMIEMKKAVN